jgi:hypothetical protein
MFSGGCRWIDITALKVAKKQGHWHFDEVFFDQFMPVIGIQQKVGVSLSNLRAILLIHQHFFKDNLSLNLFTIKPKFVCPD